MSCLDQKVIVFLVARRAGPHYSTCALQYPSPFWTLSPSSLPAPPFSVTRSRKEKGEEEKRREGKLGHVFVDPRRSSPKTCWDSSPLSVFPISMVFPCCSWWCPCVVQLGGSRRITVTLAAKQTVGNRCWDRLWHCCLCCLQWKTLGETCYCCRTCFPSSFRNF